MRVEMTSKEVSRCSVMDNVENKKISLRQASEELDISYRQAIRIRDRYRKEGIAGIISKSRGKISNNRISEDIRNKVINIIQDKYSDYGPVLVKEKLEEKYNIRLGKETIRQLMIKEGIWILPKRQKRRKYILEEPEGLDVVP